MNSLSKNRVVIAVDLDYFYAQCDEVRNPSLKDKPVVVCVFSGRTSDSGAVSTANYVARRLGVKSGMPITFAKRLLQKTPDAVFLPMDREYYDSVSSEIMSILHSHSEKFEQVSIDEAFLDVTDETGGDFASGESVAAKIKKEILDGTRLTCSVGVASNKLLAKLAADSKKPDGSTLIHPDNISGFLNPLPVGKLLGIGPKTEKRMEQLGIKTIGELANYDPEIISEQFGENLGPQLQRSSRGIDNEEVKAREHEQLSKIVTLKQDTDKFDFEDTVKKMALDISDRLLQMNFLCKTVGIIVITSNLSAKNRTRTLEISTSSESVIFSTASTLFSTYFKEERDVLARRVGIRVAGLSRMEDSSRERNSTLSEYLGQS